MTSSHSLRVPLLSEQRALSLSLFFPESVISGNYYIMRAEQISVQVFGSPAIVRSPSSREPLRSHDDEKNLDDERTSSKSTKPRLPPAAYNSRNFP